MQILIESADLPEKYAADAMHTRIRPPLKCPSCSRETSMRAHCYYRRNTTDSAGHAVSIMVRRFRCRYCQATISCLPAFVHPYRYVNCATIQRAFDGCVAALDVERNAGLLRRYWARFSLWCKNLGITLASLASYFPIKATAVWGALRQGSASLSVCTMRLVSDHQVTCFGRYRCHGVPAR